MDPTSVTEIARKVILSLARQRISMTPENYRVWFEYTIGSNEKLNRDMREVLRSGVTLSEAICQDLYERHFGASTQQALLERLAREASRILRESLERAASTGRLTGAYAARLEEFGDQLQSGQEGSSGLTKMLEQFVQGTVLDSLIAETRSVGKSALDLKDQLESAEKETERLRDQLAKVERQATMDCLTGLYNRRHMDEQLQTLLHAFESQGEVFSVVLLDLDYFKLVNDTYGHRVGDSVLEFVGSVIKGAVKGRDVPARYGGEEFAVLLPVTVCRNARKVAENIREEISAQSLKVKKTNEQIGSVTVSVGVAQVRAGDSAETLLQRADRALYLAKKRGRNNVKSEEDLEAAAA